MAVSVASTSLIIRAGALCRCVRVSRSSASVREHESSHKTHTAKLIPARQSPRRGEVSQEHLTVEDRPAFAIFPVHYNATVGIA